MNMPDGNTLDHHHQLAPVHDIGLRTGIPMWEFQSTLLESFVVEKITSFFPSQKLDPVPTLVNENEHFPGGGIASKTGMNDAT